MASRVVNRYDRSLDREGISRRSPTVALVGKSRICEVVHSQSDSHRLLKNDKTRRTEC